MAVAVKAAQKRKKGGGGIGGFLGALGGGIVAAATGGAALPAIAAGQAIGGVAGEAVKPTEASQAPTVATQDSAISRRLQTQGPDRLGQIKEGIFALKDVDAGIRSEVGPGLFQAYAKEVQSVDPGAMKRMKGLV